ncbi:MAG TPA: toxin, partial [Blastocatellia bacterium]
MIKKDSAYNFHEYEMLSKWAPVTSTQWDTQFTYTFQNFFHPFVGELLSKLNRDLLPGILDAGWQETLKHDFFKATYLPTESNLVHVEFSPKEIDVSEHGPYANYNWELFFHIPLTIAVHLSKTQRFAEAQRWFHYIFDPTSNDKSVEPLKRFWKFLAFRQKKDPKQIDELLALLSKTAAELSSDDQKLQKEILDGYTAILNKPFQPHAVARTRHLAYQYCVVMKYLDNLISWGDNLFQQDTVESI